MKIGAYSYKLIEWYRHCIFTVVVVQSQSQLWLRTHELQHTRLLCPPLFPRVCSNSCPLSWWCYLTIHPLPHPSAAVLNLYHHQGLFQWVSSLHQVAKILELHLQHQFFQWILRVDFFRIDWFDLLAGKGLSLNSIYMH